MRTNSVLRLRHPTLAEDLLAGRYEPSDELFHEDRRKYAEEVRKLEDRFRGEALVAAGLEDHPCAERIFQVAQSCAGAGDRMLLLRCLIQIADLVRALEEHSGQRP